MARQIVELPNGLYGMWSTVVDDFIELNFTQEEYIEYRAKEAYEDKKKELMSIFSHRVNFKPLKECLETISEIHGKKVAKERKGQIK